MAKDVDFKFGIIPQRQSQQWPLKIFQKWGVARVTPHVNFQEINANGYKMVKATDFKFVSVLIKQL